MSIDDTPQVKWSNAWWCYWGIGVALPVFLVAFSIYCLMTGHAYVIARASSYRAWFVTVYGFQATLMIISYPFLAIAAFGYGFARYNNRLFPYDQILTALGVIPAAALIIWCCLISVTG